jgi:hypothetical protein
LDSEGGDYRIVTDTGLQECRVAGGKKKGRKARKDALTKTV